MGEEQNESVEQKISEICDRVEAEAQDAPARVYVCGVIGAGKSKTISLLRDELQRRGLRVYVQREELPAGLFDLYLSDRKNYWFTFQAAMAHLRSFNTFIANNARDSNGDPYDVVIGERCPLDDAVFFATNAQVEGVSMEDHPDMRREYDSITFFATRRCLEQTSLFVCIGVQMEVAYRRMLTRDRAGESEAYSAESEASDYFRVLYENYQQFIDNLAESEPRRTVVLDNTQFSTLHVSAKDI